MTQSERALTEKPLPTTVSDSTVTAELLHWYDRHRRALPWRALPGKTAAPYAVWLSEIMLQQTTVASVKPYFEKFLTLWPDVNALAAASLDDVLRAWAGLGYYSRARNLHACAQAVACQHGGVFPATEAGLRLLPGIGAYSAAAIAAIAFGRKATVVDGNVERVMARLHLIGMPMPKAKAIVYGRMEAATPSDRPGDFAQAVMDLGATICTPKNPACVLCPLAEECLARQRGLQGAYPLRAPKREKPVRYGTAYYILNTRGEVLVRTRPARGMLGGMTELPGTAWLDARLPADGELARPEDRQAGCVKYAFTHFTLMLDVVVRKTPDGDTLAPVADTESNPRWIDAADLDQQALPTLMRNAIALARQIE
jgi:A/G-specific adenine glycosylase